MQKRYARLGLLGSLLLHTALFGGTAWLISQPKPVVVGEEITSISIEMFTAWLEQPEVATATEIVDPIEPEEPTETPQTEPEPVPIEQPKPVEPPKPLPKPEEKPKEKPQQKVKKAKPKTLAQEKAKVDKQGKVEKALPDAIQGNKLQNVSVGNANSTQNQASSSEINAYLAQLQRALQRKANNAYPQREKRMRKTGVATLAFRLTLSGQITEVRIVRSSGNDNLDKAAVKAAQSTQLNSAPPAGFPLSHTVPVSFTLD